MAFFEGRRQEAGGREDCFAGQAGELRLFKGEDFFVRSRQGAIERGDVAESYVAQVKSTLTQSWRKKTAHQD
ncbi:MAG: hypothetical protein D6751_11815 [Deltaproteobacteria bacterium]|nr:MAG: hypothetical protein D6751_11815 [Deltaproteobacteria bacterium]